MRFEVGYSDIDKIKQCKIVLDNVFSNNSPTELILKKKHLDKSKSICVIVFNTKNEPIACRFTMKCSFEGFTFYQHCETAVIKSERGKGIFKKMTLLSMNFISKSSKIADYINFPNTQSLRGYISLGFKHIKLNKGVVIPFLFNLTIYNLSLNALLLKYKVKIKKSVKFRRAYEVVDYESVYSLMIIAAKLAFSGHYLINISINKSGLLFYRKTNMVYKANTNDIKNFKPNWIDTVKYH